MFKIKYLIVVTLTGCGSELYKTENQTNKPIIICNYSELILAVAPHNVDAAIEIFETLKLEQDTDCPQM